MFGIAFGRDDVISAVSHQFLFVYSNPESLTLLLFLFAYVLLLFLLFKQWLWYNVYTGGLGRLVLKERRKITNTIIRNWFSKVFVQWLHIHVLK